MKPQCGTSLLFLQPGDPESRSRAPGEPQAKQGLPGLRRPQVRQEAEEEGQEVRAASPGRAGGVILVGGCEVVGKMNEERE